VIKIAKGFEMNVVAYDPFPNKKLASELNFTYAPLEEVLSKTDILTLHAPYNEKTHHLINKDNILKTKKGSYIINTARGGLIETNALVGALQNKHLGGAGLDVLELEQGLADEGAFLKGKHLQIPELKTLLEDHILMGMPNVIVTPHNAFNTKEAVTRILDTTIKNIKSFIEGHPANTITQK
jgi:D-lactate dehydrogenase